MIKTWQQRCEEHPDHDGIVSEGMIRARMQEEIDELRAAIEQAQEQETVMAEYKFQTYAAYKTEGEMKIGLVPDDAPLTLNGVPLYPHPRQWQGLTEKEAMEAVRVFRQENEGGFLVDFARAIEAKLKEKNT